MKKILLSLLFACLPFTFNAHALDEMEQNIISMMQEGNLRSLKQASKRIHNMNITDRAVLDVAAEILLQQYPTAYDAQIDTLSWLARAIGNSRDRRYFNVINSVAEKGPHKKLRRHAKKARKQIGGPEGKQYAKGMTKVKKQRYY